MSDEPNLTPSQRIIADAAQPVVLTDAMGRKLSIRRLTTLDQYNLYKAIGGEHAQNQMVYWLAAAATACSHIDGVYLTFPKNERAIDDRMKRLGDDGLNTIMLYQQGLAKVALQAAKDAQEAAERLAAENGEEAPTPSVTDPLD